MLRTGDRPPGQTEVDFYSTYLMVAGVFGGKTASGPKNSRT